MDFTRCYSLILCLTRLYRVLLVIVGSCWFSQCFTGFRWVLLDFVGFHFVFLGSSTSLTTFHRVLLAFISCCHPKTDSNIRSFVLWPCGPSVNNAEENDPAREKQNGSRLRAGNNGTPAPPPNPERFFPSETKHDDIMGNGRHTHTQKETKRATDHGSSQEIVVSPMGGTRPSLACHRVQLLVTEAHHHHHHHPPPPPPPPSIRHQTLDFHPSPYHPLILSFT